MHLTDLLEFQVVLVLDIMDAVAGPAGAGVRLDRLRRLTSSELPTTASGGFVADGGWPPDPGVRAVTYLLWQSASRLEAP